jgi:NitT/TauT family transport system ATP-binding protein
VCALVDLNLEISQGQFVAIVGPSGCGKSTLLRLIAGLVEPSDGTVSLSGQRPADARWRGMRLSLVFQDATLLPWRSVRANVRLPLELHATGNEPADARIGAALEMVGLTDFGQRFPSQLSGGMRMRASLARALVTEPELLLLDEPFGALDDITRQKLNDQLLALWNERHWTTVFITHNIAEAVYLSQRVIVMSPRPGRIVADVEIPLSMPRAGAVRSGAEFGRLVGRVSAYLREAGT